MAKTIKGTRLRCSDENIFGYVPYPTDCPCCKGHQTVILLTRDQFGGKHAYNRMAYLCKECRAMVSADNAGIAMGVLGDAETRKLRIKAHERFDKLWKDGKNPKFDSRSAAYRALARKIDVKLADCHFGYMDAYTLTSVIKMIEEGKV